MRSSIGKQTGIDVMRNSCPLVLDKTEGIRLGMREVRLGFRRG